MNMSTVKTFVYGFLVTALSLQNHRLSALLVSHNQNEKMSLPASMTLIKILAPAIPQLSAALLRDPNGYKRVKIALCLGRIGGPRARGRFGILYERSRRKKCEIVLSLY
jgi:hypothetical protein